MLKLKGTTHQIFTFPADLTTASIYYTDFARILPLLPHIQLVKDYGGNRYRVLYNTLELSIYRVRIYADLQVDYDEATRTLHVSPLLDCPPVRSTATARCWPMAQGRAGRQLEDREGTRSDGPDRALDARRRGHRIMGRPAGET